jgi:hypothetical protein
MSTMLALSSVGYFTPPALLSTTRSGDVMMKKDEGRYMYGEPFAPEGMGREFINADNVRRPLADFVGASEELNLAAFFKGEKIEPWDPLEFHKLSKVSGNNPDIAWLREAELKHGRIAMLAFVGIVFTSGSVHFPAPIFEKAAEIGWPSSLGVIQTYSPSIFFQMIATAAFIEGVSNTGRGRKENGGRSTWWDGLWFGEREGSGIVAGDLDFDPLKLMPKDPKAADLMRLKELKNGRLAMLAVMGIFMQYENTGIAFPG